MVYDLEIRTTKFSKSVIQYLKEIKVDYINESMIKQLVRAATSIGANYREANEASSKKDFRNKIAISKKEANETKYWLEIIIETSPASAIQAKRLLKETSEILLILGAIFRNTKD